MVQQFPESADYELYTFSSSLGISDYGQQVKMYSSKDKDYRRREVYALDNLHDYVGGQGGRNDRYEERRRRDVYPSCRRDSKEKDAYEGRDHKAKWVTQKSRYEHSRSCSPLPLYRGTDADVDSEIEMGGLIFMCNKKTQRRCLTYHILGMPMAKRHLVERVTLGMKLFLFEFESRELFGIFEATSRAGMNLEPDAFKEADIAFPVQVRFRVVEKCPPLREAQFKDAILENYFEANRFKFDLTKEQVFKLIQLFLPLEAPYRSVDTARNSQYVYMKGGTSVHDDQSSHDVRGPPNSRMYRRDEQWKKEPDHISKKQPYFDSHRSANHVDYATTHRDYDEPVTSAGYIPDYKLGKYHDNLGTSKLTSQRYEADTWPPAGEEYGYSNVLETMPSAGATVHHAGTSATSYSALSSKYDSLMAGYAVGRTDMATLTNETDRYWKADDRPLQVPTEPYGVKPSLYGRQGISLYGDNGSNGQRPLSLDSAEDMTLRLAGKKTLLPDVEYLPIGTSGISGLAHVLGAGRELDYRDTLPTYGSDHRRLPLGYAEDSIDAVSKHPARYALSNTTLREESGYPPSGMNFSDTGATMSSRYARDLSPRTTLHPEARYAAGPFRPLSHPKGERAIKLEDARLRTTGDENRLFGIEQPPSKPYYRHSPERYSQQSPERSIQRKPSVWERVSGILGPQRARHNNSKEFDFKNNGGYSYSKKAREHSLDEKSDYAVGDPEHPGAEDESFVVDFKRRNRNNGHAGGGHHNANIQQRKRRFVRPEAHYPAHDRTEHLQGSGS